MQAVVHMCVIVMDGVNRINVVIQLSATFAGFGPGRVVVTGLMKP
jgi:hypothetical protein